MNNSFRFVVIMLFLVGVMFGLALPGQAKSKESFDILAWPVFQEATENFSPAARFELAAMLHVHLHQYEQAIAFLEVLAKEHPNASGLWILMATAYNRLGLRSGLGSVAEFVRCAPGAPVSGSSLRPVVWGHLRASI